MKYYLLPLGCQMNQSDTERVKTILQGMGFMPTENEDEATILGIIACSVRQKGIDILSTHSAGSTNDNIRSAEFYGDRFSVASNQFHIKTVKVDFHKISFPTPAEYLPQQIKINYTVLPIS